MVEEYLTWQEITLETVVCIDYLQLSCTYMAYFKYQHVLLLANN